MADSLGAWFEEDGCFHLACYVGAPLPRVLRMIVGLLELDTAGPPSPLKTMTSTDFSVFQHEHRLMVEALRSGSVRAGETLVRCRIERTRLRLAEHRDLFDITAIAASLHTDVHELKTLYGRKGDGDEQVPVERIGRAGVVS